MPGFFRDCEVVLRPVQRFIQSAILTILVILAGSTAGVTTSTPQGSHTTNSTDQGREYAQGLYRIVSNDLLAPHTPQYEQFRGLQISDKIVYFRQRTIEHAIVERDYTLYHFDSKTRKLLAVKSHWRDDLPPQLPRLISEEQAESMVDGQIRFCKLYYISPESYVFPTEPTPQNPCWVIESIKEGRIAVTLVDAVEGKIAGYGIPPPYTAVAFTGPTDTTECSGGWYAWYQNARDWFNTMGYDTATAEWPTEANVRNMIQSDDIAMFYEFGHGGSTSFSNACDDSTRASEVEAWIADYDKMPFTFLGSCGGMCSTGNNTFSYEFRKGSNEGAVTVGYCGMADSPCVDDCWYAGYTIDWQTVLFDYMNRGWTTRAAFDQANAEYPGCGLNSCMRFAGDGSFTAIPLVSRRRGLPSSRWFVDATATAGANNGTTWADAYASLQDALSAASGGDEIWVAQGTYTPDKGAGISPKSQTATFQLKNGVTVKGGFAGISGPDPNARHIARYRTILSGDLNGDDGLNFANYAENSFHVVSACGTNRSAVLDGVTIIGGNAHGAEDMSRAGAGIYNQGGSPIIINCTITANRAYNYGGGMYNEAGSPVLGNCTLTANSAFHYAGRFGAGNGGAIYSQNSSQMLTTCIFSGNLSGHSGGAIFNRESDLTLVNCTLSGNSTDERGGGICNIQSHSDLTNSILWQNSADLGGQIALLTNSTLLVRYSCLQDGQIAIYNDGTATITTGDGIIDTDPNFVRNPDDGGDGWGRGNNDDLGDLHLLPCSPCIETGDPGFIPPPDTVDIDGQRRVIGNRVDIGADEFVYAADLDMGGSVDYVDFAIFGRQWCRMPGPPSADIAPDMGDGIVDLLDLALLVQDWLKQTSWHEP